MDFAQLRDAKIDSLQNLADDWSTISDTMFDATSDNASGVSTPMRSGNWTGEAAVQAEIRQRELSDLIADGYTEANAIHDILEDAVTRFTDVKSSLDDILTELDSIEQLSVSDDGTVQLNSNPAPPYAPLEGFEALLWQGHQAAYQRRIATVLLEAVAADSDIAEALRFAAETTDPDDNTFNGKAVNMEGLAELREDRDRVIEILDDIDPANPDPDQLEELNQLLARHGDNPVFATELLRASDGGLGPEALTTHLGNIAFAASRSGDAELVELTQSMQENMGIALATATNPENEPHLGEAWIGQFMEAGAQTGIFLDHPDATDPYSGYQILAPLLEHGEYHEDFLVPVAEHLVRLDQINQDSSPNFWVEDSPFNLGEASANDNPLNSALIGLNNSPAAATAFFSGSDDYADMPYTAVDGRDLDPVAGGNLSYLLDRAGTEVDDHDSISVDHLGNAIQAATTGLPSHAPAGTPPVAHSSEMATVTDELIQYVSENQPSIDSGQIDLSAMNDNLSEITVNYMADVHQILGGTTPGDNPEEHITWATPSFGEPLSVGREHMERFLETLGTDPEAALRIAIGSEYNASVQLAEVVHTADPDEPVPTNRAASSMAGHAEVMGSMSAGQIDEIYRAYEVQASSGGGIPVADLVAETARNAVGVTVGIATENPWAGMVARQGSGYIIDAIVDQFRADGGSTDHSAEADSEGDQTRNENLTEFQAWIDNTLEGAGVTNAEDRLDIVYEVEQMYRQRTSED